MLTFKFRSQCNRCKVHEFSACVDHRRYRLSRLHPLKVVTSFSCVLSLCLTPLLRVWETESPSPFRVKWVGRDQRFPFTLLPVLLVRDGKLCFTWVGHREHSYRIRHEVRGWLFKCKGEFLLVSIPSVVS